MLLRIEIAILDQFRSHYELVRWIQPIESWARRYKVKKDNRNRWIVPDRKYQMATIASDGILNAIKATWKWTEYDKTNLFQNQLAACWKWMKLSSYVHIESNRSTPRKELNIQKSKMQDEEIKNFKQNKPYGIANFNTATRSLTNKVSQCRWKSHDHHFKNRSQR